MVERKGMRNDVPRQRVPRGIRRRPFQGVQMAVLLFAVITVLAANRKMRKSIMLVMVDNGYDNDRIATKEPRLIQDGSSASSTYDVQAPDYSCLEPIQEQLAQKQKEWRAQMIPLMTSIIHRPQKQITTVLFNILQLKARSNSSDWWEPHMVSWRCLSPTFDLRATSVDHINDPHNKGLLYVTCPLGTEQVQARKQTHHQYWHRFRRWIQGYKTVLVYKYDIDMSSASSEAAPTDDRRTRSTSNDDKKQQCLTWGMKGQSSSPNDIIACTEIQDRWILTIEYIAYYYLLGVDRFYFYVNEQLRTDNDNTTSFTHPHDKLLAASQSTGFRLPERLLTERVHFIPFHEYLGRSHILQASALNDCMVRAHDAQVPWVMMNDIDEYFQIMNETYQSSLKRLLQAMVHDDETVDAVEVKHWQFGPNLANQTVFPDKFQLHMEHYHWRVSEHHPLGREKIFVRPDRVRYVHIHSTWRGKKDFDKLGEFNTRTLDSKTEMRMVHFRRPHKGINKTGEAPIYDDSLPRQFAAKMRALLLPDKNDTVTY